MEHQELIRHLKTLSALQPTLQYRARGRARLEALAPSRRFRLPRFAWGAGAVSAVMALFVLGFALQARQQAYASLEREALRNELEKLATTIQVDRVAYGNEIDSTIASALHVITTNKAPHLDETLLQKERDAAEAEPVTSEIDELLEQITL